MGNRMLFCSGLTAIALITTVAGAAFADTVKFKADLSGSSEVPPDASAGKGTLDATYDTTPSS
jgi:hypothetical protein